MPAPYLLTCPLRSLDLTQQTTELGHGGYAVSQRVRKRIEEAFGWIKTVAGGTALEMGLAPLLWAVRRTVERYSGNPPSA